MLVGPASGHPAASGAAKETLLNEVGLVDVFQGLGLLGHGQGQGGSPHRTAAMVADEAFEDAAIHEIQTGFVDAQALEPEISQIPRDPTGALHLGEIA